MRNIILSLIVLSAACAHPNLAQRAVKQFDSRAECVPAFTDAGANHTHSCIVAGPSPLYCTLDATLSSALCSPLIRMSNELQKKQPEQAPATGTSEKAPEAARPPAAAELPPVEKPKSTSEPKKK